MDDMECMKEDVVARLHELTDVDFERDSAVTEQAQLRSLLTQFMENEARSCSMDFGCITPQYVFRMFGGSVSIDEITNALNYLKANNYGY
jgi:hypothetical protein